MKMCMPTTKSRVNERLVVGNFYENTQKHKKPNIK